MAQKRREESEFKVSDKRLFTSDGELRSDSPEEQAAPPVASAATATAVPEPSHSRPVSTIPQTASAPASPTPESDIPQPPTPPAQHAQHHSQKQSPRRLG